MPTLRAPTPTLPGPMRRALAALAWLALALAAPARAADGFPAPEQAFPLSVTQFDPQGRERRDAHQVGEFRAEDLLRHRALAGEGGS